MNVATHYMKKAGYPSGRSTGNDNPLIVGSNADLGKAVAEVAKAQLEKLGFKSTLRAVPDDSLYTEWCQQPKKKVAVCARAAWFKDFLNPQSMLEITFKGSNIVKSGGNNNPAELNGPKIDAAMDKAAGLQGAQRLAAWGQIDKMITSDAAAVPLMWDKTTLVWSKDVRGVANEYCDTIDFAFTSLSSPGWARGAARRRAPRARQGHRMASR